MATRLCWSLLLCVLLFLASHAVNAQTPPGGAYAEPGAAGASPPAGAGGNPAAMAAGQACRDDIGQFCAGVQPGGGRIAQCLKAHGRQLSPGCVSALKAARAAR